MRLFLLLLLSASSLFAGLDGGAITAPRSGVTKGGYCRSFWFLPDTSATMVWRNTGTTSGNSTYKDRNYATSSSTKVTDFYWGYTSELDRPTSETVNRTTSNSSMLVADTNNPSLWNYGGSPGSVTLTFSSPSYTTNMTVTAQSSTGVVATFISFNGTSAAQASKTEVDGMLAGKNPATDKAIFSSQNHGAGTYVRNPTFWAASYAQALTCASPWNSTGANTRAGTLVSPRHIVFSTHYQILPGATIRFVTTGNVTVTRTLQSSAVVVNDLMVGLLDSDVPGTISFARYIAEADYAKLPWPTSYAEAASNAWAVPLLAFDQEEKGLVTDPRHCDPSYRAWTNSVPTDSQRLAFYEPLIGGDSGNPCFFLLGGQVALLTVWMSGGPGGGTSVTYCATQLNSAMTALSVAASAGTDYQLTPLDLSAYPGF